MATKKAQNQEAQKPATQELATQELATMEPAKNNLPAFVDAIVAESAVGKFAIFQESTEEIQDIITANLGEEQLDIFTLDRIKVPAGGSTIWMVPGIDGDEPVKELVGLIIGDFVTRSYWQSEYGSTESGPPDCYSVDGLTGIGNPGGDCNTCPFAQFGTAQGGRGKGQACSKKRTMFILTENDILPKMLNIPPASLKEATRYLMRLLNGRLSKHHTLTKFTLVKDKNAGGIDYAKVQFANVPGSVPKEARPAIDAYINSIMPSIRAAMGRVAQSRLDDDHDTNGQEDTAVA
jgi:hypothetical protein